MEILMFIRITLQLVSDKFEYFNVLVFYFIRVYLVMGINTKNKILYMTLCNFIYAACS